MSERFACRVLGQHRLTQRKITVLAEGFACGLHRIERIMREKALRTRPRRRGLRKTEGGTGYRLAQSPGSTIRVRRPEPEVGRRLHVYLDGRGLALPVRHRLRGRFGTGIKCDVGGFSISLTMRKRRLSLREPKAVRSDQFEAAAHVEPSAPQSPLVFLIRHVLD